MDSMEMISELPPKLTNGSGTPVKGTEAVMTAMFMNAWITIQDVSPTASSFPYSSDACMLIVNPRYARITKSVMTATAPSKPSSSAVIAKMLSVYGAGK